MQALQPSPADELKRQGVLQELQDIVQAAYLYPDAGVQVYGSFLSGM